MKKRNVLIDECNSAIILLKILGLFPLQMGSASRFKFKYVIAATLYSCAVYTFSMLLAFKQIRRRVSIINTKTCDFDCLIFSIGTLLVLTPITLVPLAFWCNMRRTILFWEEWYHFQIRYELLIGKPIEIPIKRFVTIFVVSSMSAVPLATTLPALFIADFNFVATSTYYVVFSEFFAGVSYWLAVCMLLKRAACHILQFTNESFTRWSQQNTNFVNCYELWMTLQTLLKQFGNSMEFFLLIYGFNSMLTFLNSLYGFVSQLYTTELKSKNIIHASGHLILVAWSGSVIFIVNESSHQVINTFTYEFRRQIFFSNMNKMNGEARHQIIEFYQIFRGIDSKLSFSGFNKLSRAFFITILGATITYMVIMLQIRNDYLFWQEQASTIDKCLESNYTKWNRNHTNA